MPCERHSLPSLRASDAKSASYAANRALASCLVALLLRRASRFIGQARLVVRQAKLALGHVGVIVRRASVGPPSGRRHPRAGRTVEREPVRQTKPARKARRDLSPAPFFSIATPPDSPAAGAKGHEQAGKQPTPSELLAPLERTRASGRARATLRRAGAAGAGGSGSPLDDSEPPPSDEDEPLPPPEPVLNAELPGAVPDDDAFELESELALDEVVEPELDVEPELASSMDDRPPDSTCRIGRRRGTVPPSGRPGRHRFGPALGEFEGIRERLVGRGTGHVTCRPEAVWANSGSWPCRESLRTGRPSRRLPSGERPVGRPPSRCTPMPGHPRKMA